MKIFNIARRIPYVPFLFFLLISCSSEDKPAPESSEPLLSSIRLTANENATEMPAGSNLSFTVEGDDGEDYTSSSQITVNGEAIPGNSYRFESPGNFIIKANYQSLTSNTLSVNIYQNRDPTSLSLIINMPSENPSIDEKVTFSLIGDNGIDYTSEAIIKVNGEEIEGYHYTFQEGGEHTFMATAVNLNSNEIKVNVESSNFIRLSNYKILRNQSIKFTVLGAEDSDVTSSSKFYVNGNPITGNSFQSSETGIYEVYAVINENIQTSPKNFEVFIPRRSILFEDYTGTWCGWCPRITEVIEELEKRSDQVAIVAYHLGDDIMRRDENDDLARSLEIETLPHGRYNRVNVLEYPENEESKILTVLEKAGDNTDTSISIETELENEVLSFRVSLISETQLEAAQKLTILLLQNDIVYPQENYFNYDETSKWFDKGYPIEDFRHNDVVERNITNIQGDNISETPALTEYTLEYGSINLSEYAYEEDKNGYDQYNFDIVAFITDVNGEVINARKVRVGQDADYK